MSGVQKTDQSQKLQNYPTANDKKIETKQEKDFNKAKRISFSVPNPRDYFTEQGNINRKTENLSRSDKYAQSHPRLFGRPNQKNIDGYYIRDEKGYLDAPHEREDDHYK